MTSTQSKKNAANKCLSAYPTCVQTCRSSAEKYSESENWSTFNAAVGTCSGYAQKASALNDGGKSSLAASDAGLNCLTNSSQSPQSAGGEGGASEAQRAAAAQAAACATNPASAECQSQPQYAAAKAATAGFNETEPGKGSFDTGDTSGLNVGSIIGGSGESTPGGAGVKNGTIANNSGGGIPGGAGGGSGAKGGGGGLGGVVSGALSALTDIEKGFLGGGYSQLLSGENPWSNEPPDPATLNRALATLGASKAIDLRRYLPGHDLAPVFRSPAEIREFYGPGVDIFSRIHDRFEVKCRLGELIDCR